MLPSLHYLAQAEEDARLEVPEAPLLRLVAGTLEPRHLEYALPVPFALVHETMPQVLSIPRIVVC